MAGPRAVPDIWNDTWKPAWASGTKAGNGDNELIAAPGAGWRIVVVAFCIQNESATATTLILKNGSTNGPRVLGQVQGDGLAMSLGFHPWRLSDNTALNLNLSGANSCGYNIYYFLERV